MTQVTAEYQRYQKSDIMKRLAEMAHGDDYLQQTSSATYEEIAHQVRAMSLASGAYLLDAGCGVGLFDIRLTNEFPINVHGVDIGQGLVEEAKKNIPSVQKNSTSFSVEDFTTLPMQKEAAFDAVICVGCLYWGQSLETTFNTWRRVTRTNSHLLLFLNLIFSPLNSKDKAIIGHTQFISALDMQRSLSQAGWALTEWIDATITYKKWLQRWCHAMQNLKQELYKEMSAAPAEQLISRFQTYFHLAEQRVVRRIILRAEHVDI